MLPFTGHHNSDGVAFSVDREKWYRLISLSSSSFTSQVFDLDAELVKLKEDGVDIDYTSDFLIKFQQYDNNPTSRKDCRAFDNIMVTAD